MPHLPVAWAESDRQFAVRGRADGWERDKAAAGAALMAACGALGLQRLELGLLGMAMVAGQALAHTVALAALRYKPCCWPVSVPLR